MALTDIQFDPFTGTLFQFNRGNSGTVSESTIDIRNFFEIPAKNIESITFFVN